MDSRGGVLDANTRISNEQYFLRAERCMSVFNERFSFEPLQWFTTFYHRNHKPQPLFLDWLLMPTSSQQYGVPLHHRAPAKQGSSRFSAHTKDHVIIENNAFCLGAEGVKAYLQYSML